MSLPTARLIWHCPYIVLYYSADKQVRGPGYKEFALIRLDGEHWESDGHATNNMIINKTDDFEDWETWKKVNKAGMDCKVSIHRESRRITVITENAGIQIRSVTILQEDIPDILIISDMEFDASVGSNSSMGTCYCRLQDKNPTLFDDIAKQWKTFGYELPSVTFWNVNSRTNSVPMQKNKLGVKLVSGFSQNVLDLVMNSELTPFDALKNILTGERYSPVALEESV